MKPTMTRTPPMVDHLRNRVLDDIKSDIKEIGKGYCDEVLGALGKDGRVIPNLLRVKD
jgi:hypothetical protein